jgi:hypothetical protein
MSSTTRIGFVAGASMLAVSTVSLAGTGMDAQDYDHRIANLERQLAELRGDRSEVRSDEIRALVNEALADADTRSSLLQSGMVAGWDNGFMLGSADGNYTLKLKGQVQVRYVANLRDNSGDDDTEYGFEVRRSKLEFSGNIVDQSWGYKVRGAFDRAGGGFELEDAYIEKKLDNMTVRVGQFKPQYLREENISSARQQAADRSLANERYNQDYAQGVQVAYAQDNFKVSGMVHDGFGSRNTSAVAQTSEFAFSGRADVLIAGNWKQFDDYAGWRGQEYGARVGGGFYFQKAAYGTAAANEAEVTGFTVDTQVEGDGWNVAAAFIYRSTDNGVAASVDEMAFVLQGGYFFTDNTELFARYEWGDDDGTDGFEDLSVITAGVNHYFDKHNAKLTVDVVFGLDPIGGDFASSGAGIQTDAANQDGQVAIRGQFQLLF